MKTCGGKFTKAKMELQKENVKIHKKYMVLQYFPD
jgi:hypothetical protein